MFYVYNNALRTIRNAIVHFESFLNITLFLFILTLLVTNNVCIVNTNDFYRLTVKVAIISIQSSDENWLLFTRIVLGVSIDRIIITFTVIGGIHGLSGTMTAVQQQGWSVFLVQLLVFTAVTLTELSLYISY